MFGSSKQTGSSLDDVTTRETAEALGERIADHLQARSELFQIEAKEAGQFVARKTAATVAVVIAVFFAYALFVVAIVILLGGLIDRYWSDPPLPGAGWLVAALLMSLVHALVAGLLFRRLRRKPAEPLFEYSRAEIQKDIEWIQRRKSGNESGDSR